MRGFDSRSQQKSGRVNRKARERFQDYVKKELLEKHIMQLAIRRIVITLRPKMLVASSLDKPRSFLNEETEKWEEEES